MKRITLGAAITLIIASIATSCLGAWTAFVLVPIAATNVSILSLLSKFQAGSIVGVVLSFALWLILGALTVWWQFRRLRWREGWNSDRVQFLWRAVRAVSICVASISLLAVIPIGQVNLAIAHIVEGGVVDSGFANPMLAIGVAALIGVVVSSIGASEINRSDRSKQSSRR